MVLTRDDYLKMYSKITNGEYENRTFNDVDEKFYQDACEALQINPHSRVSKLIYNRAYNEAHSNGWSAILDEMDDLVDFILEVNQVVRDDGQLW